MSTKQKQQSNKVLLSSERVTELGNELTDIMNILEMNNLAIEGVEMVERVDMTAYHHRVNQYFDIAHTQNQKLIRRLDRIAFLLLNNHDANGLEL